MIRLLLVDDHKMLRQSLRTLLAVEPDIEVVDDVQDGEDALLSIIRFKPDVVLMDIIMPRLGGIETIHRIVERRLQTKVLILSSHNARRFVTHALNGGAMGYITKAAGFKELTEGIRVVATGQSYLSSDVALMLATGSVDPMLATGPVDEQPQAKLGRREIEVLKLIAQGETSRAIAGNLCITNGTVEMHRYNIMHKLGLHNSADLTLYAIYEGLIPI